MTRILSVFNLLKRVGFAVLLLGVNFCFAQDWETPIRLTSDSTIWHGPPVMLVDDSLNLHVFAIRINDSLREETGWVIFHSLYYMKFTNWGRPIITPMQMHRPVSPEAESYGPAAVLDSHGRIHIFWGEYGLDGCPDCLFYAQMDLNGNFVVEPRLLEHSDPIFFQEYLMNAVEAPNGTIWATSNNWVVAVSPEGNQLSDAIPITESESTLLPILAIGPDSSVWVCYEWGTWPDRISIRRMDIPDSEPIDILRSTPEMPLDMGHLSFFIDYTGARHFQIGLPDSIRLLRVSADGLSRDSIAYYPNDWPFPSICPLAYLRPDTFLHIYRDTRQGANDMRIVRFSLNTEIIQGPEVHQLSGFGTSGASVLSSRGGGYWLPGGGSDGAGYNYLSMLHVPGPDEPLAIHQEQGFYAQNYITKVVAYPSPFADKIFLIPSTEVGLISEVSLHNVLGQKLTTFDLSSNYGRVLSLNIPAHISNGPYFLQIRGSRTTQALKIIRFK